MSHRDREIELLKEYQADLILYENIEEGMLIRPANLIEFFKSANDLETYYSINLENIWTAIDVKRGFVILVPLLVLEIKPNYCKFLKKEEVVYIPKISIQRIKFAILKKGK